MTQFMHTYPLEDLTGQPLQYYYLVYSPLHLYATRSAKTLKDHALCFTSTDAGTPG
ncbi:MAG TPA: hypothetical protein VGE04_08080 [Chloroflexia bacterium]